MAAYIVVQLEITDPETFETYRAQVPATLEQYGGEFIVRGGDREVLEGEWPWPRMVILKFPARKAAKAWHASAEYQGPKALRQAASKGNMIVVDGV
ncbi:MAG: D-fructose-6-phosphate amidotransferase [Rhodospirillaceae bacterium]|jgi:uncharacterized protein (DUF1330 family)|nr:D-fructose-6-phosphate amidotransferase [Rhodospirillaceae bacterium]|tara:strand:+ start:4227 stop:4514 length:288 start_codon:yes stop_codon:yes gene_type:complete